MNLKQMVIISNAPFLKYECMVNNPVTYHSLLCNISIIMFLHWTKAKLDIELYPVIV